MAFQDPLLLSVALDILNPMDPIAGTIPGN